MLSTIIQKELKSIISSPKFAITFAACSVLILLSVWIGIQDYRAGMERTDAALEINSQVLKTITWNDVHTRAFRHPDPMQVFVAGVNNDVGRLSEIRSREEVNLKNSVYSDDSIFAVFRLVDFAFIVQIVLSLLAILFTYDAINGEREGGTLQLTFSNPVPRAKYILGKLIGSWLGLVIPLSIPILLSILLVLIMKIPMTPLHWQKLGGLFLVSLLYFTFFIALGLLTSALSRSSATSFLISLVIWVLFVFIVPRAGIMAAGQVVDVPSVAEMKSRQAAYTKEKQDEYQARMNEYVQSLIKRQMSMLKPNMTPQERNEMTKNLQGELEKEIRKERKVMEAAITDYGYRLHEERRNRQAQQERLGFLLCRFSPAASFRLAAMNLAETDVLLKTRAEKAMTDFRSNLLEMAELKTREQGSEGMMGGIRTRTYQRNDGTTVIGFDRRTPPTVNPEDVPIFVQDPRTFGDTASDTLMDIGLLAIYSIVSFSITFVAFLRYDVR